MNDDVNNFKFNIFVEDNNIIVQSYLQLTSNNNKFIIPCIMKNNEFIYEAIPIIFTKGNLKGKEGLLKVNGFRTEYSPSVKKFITDLSLTALDGTEIDNCDLSDIKQKAIKKNYKTTITVDILDIKQTVSVQVKIKGRRTTVILPDKTRGSVYCNIDDCYDEEIGVTNAVYKALSNKILKQIK